MIHIDRSLEPPPDALTRTDRSGLTETERAIRFYDNLENRNRSFPFRAYRDKSVKAALENLFHGKCAYCESRYAGTQPMDVEHWRPKGEVHTEEGTVLPGYYWLAANWRNLFPSCIDCNRQRSYISDQGAARTRGKGNRFPLETGSTYAGEPGREAAERPVLLNPCEQDPNRYPERHLQFIEHGVVGARIDSAGQASTLGTASIDVYHLNRTELVHDRQELRLLISQRLFTLQQLNLILDSLLAQDGAGTDPQRENLINLVEDLIAHEMRGLRRFMQPEQPFSLMARQLIEAAMASLDEE